ncbi:MAG: penicillin-binding protein activator LpoB [Deltaproteobacteria bacterium]|nr:penicillin-binding protein activator LpoB [Deltaproteobacteria bacterium]
MRAVVVISAALGAVAIAAAGCSGMPDVKRVDPNTQTDFSGRWNDTDSRMVSESMIENVLKGRWIADYASKSGGRKPRIIVGTIRNRTLEHINVGTFVNDLQRAIINSGRATFVASRGERDEVREERFDQAVHASEETRKEPSKEHGADYMLKGEINSTIDQAGSLAAVYYQIDLTLIDLESTEKVWIGDKKIKKVVEHGSLAP